MCNYDKLEDMVDVELMNSNLIEHLLCEISNSTVIVELGAFTTVFRPPYLAEIQWDDDTALIMESH